MTNQERIDNLIIKTINLTLELRELKKDIKELEYKTETKISTTLELEGPLKNPIYFHK